jgi:hypothetical protein
MTQALRVIAPGLLTTIQDLGRPGYQHVGIPPSGALDPVSLRAANGPGRRADDRARRRLRHRGRVRAVLAVARGAAAPGAVARNGGGGAGSVVKRAQGRGS